MYHGVLTQVIFSLLLAASDRPEYILNKFTDSTSKVIVSLRSPTPPGFAAQPAMEDVYLLCPGPGREKTRNNSICEPIIVSCKIKGMCGQLQGGWLCHGTD
jgi:hypothetical protein